MLQAQSISKSYGTRQILSGVSLAVEPGTACVVIGPSGAGKSTLLRCVGLLEASDSGTVSLDGKVTVSPELHGGPDGPWPDLTVVFQQHFLWPHLTLRENITLPLETRMSPQEIVATVSELEVLFDMRGFLDRHPNEASLGQRQRVALARALALRPRYILLDEVTSSLDVEQIENLYRHLLVLLQRGIGVLIVTHLLGLARAILRDAPGSDLIFLDAGTVVAQGGAELLDAPPAGRVRDFVAKMQLAS